MTRIDARDFEYLILYLPTGEYVRWADNLELITTNSDYDVWTLCSYGKVRSTYALSDDSDFIEPVLREHFELVKRKN